MPNDDNPHKNHRTRLRNKATPKPDALDPYQLLELLLFEVTPRQDTNPAAHTLIDRLGGVSGFINAPEQEPAQSGSTAQYLKTVKAMCSRYLHYQDPSCEVFYSLYAARSSLFNSIPDPQHNTVTLVALNKALVKNRSIVFPADSFDHTEMLRALIKEVMQDYSAFLFLVISHPEGFLTLTGEETALIKELSAFCKGKQLYLADVILQTNDGFRCLNETGLFPEGTFLNFRTELQPLTDPEPENTNK